MCGITGFIAQEVETVFPEWIYTEDGYKAINYSGFNATVVNALQEMNKIVQKQQEMIEQQQKEIEELKTKIK